MIDDILHKYDFLQESFLQYIFYKEITEIYKSDELFKLLLSDYHRIYIEHYLNNDVCIFNKNIIKCINFN
jgi:hypothetical protein